MAEDSNRRSFNADQEDAEDIQVEIQRLLKEKDELERRNKEKQDAERLRQLRESVSVLKSGGASPSNSKNRQDSYSGRRSLGENISSDLNSSLAESQARLRALQQDVLNTSHGGASNLNTSRDDSSQSLDEADEDDVMTTAHKQALRANRDVLVENMTPDDIFNDLISKHVLSTSDVSRIKDKNTIEAMNEELLNVLVRRSDRAFHVFVASLRRTLQGWLANRLDPCSQNESRHKRKRRTGELNIDVDCRNITPASKKKYTCTCQEVEEQILVMAKGAFANIRRRDSTPSAFEQFRKELHTTNEIIRESMEIMNTLKMLCRHGDLTDLSNGSIRFTLRLKSLSACKQLWEDYKSGFLIGMFQKGLVTPTLLSVCGAMSIRLAVSISELEYLHCALELAFIEQQAQAQLACQRLTPMKRRLRCWRKENRKNNVKEDDLSCDVKKVRSQKRQAFQEISHNALPVNRVVIISEPSKTVSSIRQHQIHLRSDKATWTQDNFGYKEQPSSVIGKDLIPVPSSHSNNSCVRYSNSKSSRSRILDQASLISIGSTSPADNSSRVGGILSPRTYTCPYNLRGKHHS